MNDLENTYHWLVKEDNFLPVSAKVLVRQLHNKAEAGEFSDTLRVIEELKSASQLGDKLAQAHVSLEFAWAYYMMHDLIQAGAAVQAAVSLLEAGASKNPAYKYYLAVAHWMLGNLATQPNDPNRPEVIHWEKSRQAFNELKYTYAATADEQWYQERCTEMGQAISAALLNSHAAVYLPRATLQCGQRKNIEILKEIPAGGLKPAGNVAVSGGQITLEPSMDEFRIDGKPYLFYTLLGSRRISVLEPGKSYYALKLADDSMDRIGLVPGDYVLLSYQDEAENGDIVAAEIPGEDTQAALKTYLQKKDQVILRPQSLNPEQEEYIFTPSSISEYHIRGVALGVFKPLTGIKAPAEKEPAERQEPAQPEEGEAAPAEEQEQVPQDSQAAPPSEQAEQVPPEQQEPATQEQETEPEEADPAGEAEGQAIPIQDVFQLYEIFEKIPAGGPQAAPEPSGVHVDVGLFWIEGKPHRLKVLRRGERSFKAASKNLMVLKVSGDSMNLAGIDNGDYVLLQGQEEAVDGDIVAAEIRNEDTQATLKRYLKRNGKIVLQAESSHTDLAGKEWEFEKPPAGEAEFEETFFIRGIAVAVLKPIDETAIPYSAPRAKESGRQPPNDRQAKAAAGEKETQAQEREFDEETWQLYRVLTKLFKPESPKKLEWVDRYILYLNKRYPKKSPKELIQEAIRRRTRTK